MVDRTIENLLAAAHVKPNSFEAALGLLCHEWITLTNLDDVIEGLDEYILALETRRDIEFNRDLKGLPPSPSEEG